MAPISIDIKRFMIIKLKDGWFQRKIAMDLDISRHGVQKILTKFQRHKTLEDLQNLVDREEMMTDVRDY